jgi:hypothetical protein
MTTKSFKNFLNERINMLEGGDQYPALKNVIDRTFNLVTQFHIYHLLTVSYAEHMAIGDFYNCLNSTVDSLSETFIGIGGIVEVTGASVQNSYSKEMAISELTSYRELVSSALSETDWSAMQSINDDLINIQKAIDTLLYKFGLN